MAERRDRKGQPQGVKSPSPTWKAMPSGRPATRVSGRGTCLRHALGRSHTVNPGDIKQNTRDFASARHPRLGHDPHRPVAFVVDYADGLRGTALILNGHVDDTTVAVRLKDPGRRRHRLDRLDPDVPARPPGCPLLRPPGLADRRLLQDRQAPYPVERTLLTGGILDAALDSRLQRASRSPPPNLPASTTLPRSTRASSASH